MSIFNNPEENYWRNFATKTVLILITVAIIVWFLPRYEGRMFRYDVGKPWMYGSVIAKFDFPIYKTDEAIKREQDSLMKQFQPYYSVNESIGSEQVSRFLHDFSQGVPGLPKEYVTRDTAVTLPMKEGQRSLNLSNSVAITVYEVIRQNGI